ncbi:MAG: RNA methyltransferase [Anaerolineae bacterium]|nr:RNA methyltransferase [Anaerolineae bacterium]
MQNPRIKLARALQDKKAREREARFLVDDLRDLQRALHLGYEVDYALFCPALATGAELDLAQTLPQVYETSAEAQAKAAYREHPNGLIAVLRSHQPRGLDDLVAQQTPYMLVLVNLQKPGNIGALLRSADAAGFGPVLLIDSTLDIYNPNIIRASTGAVFLDNLFALTSDQALPYLTAHYHLLAGHLRAEQSLFEADLRPPLALVLGAEDQGLPPRWANACRRIKIPMVGRITDSLNVSVSGAIFMYEALRQRSNTS